MQQFESIVRKAGNDPRVVSVEMVDREGYARTWWLRGCRIDEDRSLSGSVAHYAVVYEAGGDRYGRCDGDTYLRFGLPPKTETVPEAAYPEVVLRVWIGFYLELRKIGAIWSVWTWRPGSGWDWSLKTVRRQEAAKRFRTIEAAAWAA